MKMQSKYKALLRQAEKNPNLDGSALESCFRVLSVAAAIDQDCAQRLTPLGLSEARFILLFLLQEQPQGLSPHTLADQAGVSRATITSVVDGLERKGWVTRHHDQKDRRSLSVRLTDAGTAVIRSTTGQHTRWIASLFTDFTREERIQLNSLLEKLWLNTDQGRNPLSATSRE